MVAMVAIATCIFVSGFITLCNCMTNRLTNYCSVMCELWPIESSHINSSHYLNVSIYLVHVVNVCCILHYSCNCNCIISRFCYFPVIYCYLNPLKLDFIKTDRIRVYLVYFVVLLSCAVFEFCIINFDTCWICWWFLAVNAVSLIVVVWVIIVVVWEYGSFIGFEFDLMKLFNVQFSDTLSVIIWLAEMLSGQNFERT